LLWCGVKLSKDGKSIFNYNPGKLQAGLNYLLALPFLPSFLNRAHGLQLLFLFGFMQLYMWVLSDCTAQGPGELDKIIVWCYDNIAGLSRFVLGLFVSLVLSKTYYANRGFFGTVFGCSMALAQMTASWVRVPPADAGNSECEECVRKAQELLVRWINAGFRLMWLESVPGLSAEEIEKDMVGQDLLTQAEWDKVKGLSSRCTHIYQWMTNVLSELLDWGYIASPNQLVMMQEQVDQMRGANVWGLPSLPIAYTMIITHMVKSHVLVLAAYTGALAAEQFAVAEVYGYTRPRVVIIWICHVELVVHHFLFQGLLDLHGALYNPNSGTYLGHLPSLNFMDFVKDVTEHLNSENKSLPYKLDLVKPPGGKGNDGMKSLKN